MSDRIPTSRRPSGRLLSTLLSVLIVCLLAWLGWQLWGTNVAAEHRQRGVVGALQDEWGDRGGDATSDPLRLGEGFAVLRVPRFGEDFEVPVIQGVSEDDLASGVGHFSDTARPGQVGNFAVAGHRVTRGQPFADFPSLRAGDEVTVETRTHLYTYVLDDDGTDIEVPASDTSVIRPVPGRPGAVPDRALITLVTCADLTTTEDRSIVHGHLVSSTHL
ncbi:class E sortase [Nocardioides daeguensis]|uniref:Class E sortase n=1 Tax=Nocardioides daeguensis TaxID=908359 RepID=A0ABP6WH04_9ACTN|nr:class E sortase [Nocardioides daeguensis]MBV6727964.1 class E sortase [Nocardioides daeguensis]MCR1774038.1 class E sortase [Nocardioides daeguensis]